jgi:hypothetical protein
MEKDQKPCNSETHMHLLGRSEENQNKPQSPSQDLRTGHPEDEDMVHT